MTSALTYAAMRAGAVINDAIESLLEDDGLLAHEIRIDLIEAYSDLCKVLSGVLGVDAHKMIQRISEAEIETSRAILRAQVQLHRNRPSAPAQLFGMLAGSRAGRNPRLSRQFRSVRSAARPHKPPLWRQPAAAAVDRPGCRPDRFS